MSPLGQIVIDLGTESELIQKADSNVGAISAEILSIWHGIVHGEMKQVATDEESHDLVRVITAGRKGIYRESAHGNEATAVIAPIVIIDDHPEMSPESISPVSMSPMSHLSKIAGPLRQLRRNDGQLHPQPCLRIQ